VQHGPDVYLVANINIMRHEKTSRGNGVDVTLVASFPVSTVDNKIHDHLFLSKIRSAWARRGLPSF
jgi:hypothetical protein